MTTDIVECLRGRREFYNYDPGRWMMSDKPDRDCQAAADEIERLRTRLEIDPGQQYDGIATRDATIKLLEVEIETLRASLAAYRRRLPAFVPPEAEISVVEWPKL